MIIIAQGLSAHPPTVNPLPGTTTLRQVLQSTLPVEPVLIEYRLDASHNIWFDDGGPHPRKSVTFRENIQVGGTPLAHPITLTATHPAPAIHVVQIEEFVTDGAGGKQSGVVLIGL